MIDIVELQEAQHNSSTPMPSVKHSASMRDSPRSGRAQHNASPPTTPTARRLDSLEASQTPSTVLKPSLEDTLGRLQTPAGNGPLDSGSDMQEHQSELAIPQQTSEVPEAVEQRQQKASGLSNRHLSEEDDQQEEDEADDSQASDTDDEEDSDEEDEADEAAGDSWQVLYCASCSTLPTYAMHVTGELARQSCLFSKAYVKQM